MNSIFLLTNSCKKYKEESSYNEGLKHAVIYRIILQYLQRKKIIVINGTLFLVTSFIIFTLIMSLRKYQSKEKKRTDRIMIGTRIFKIHPYYARDRFNNK